MMRRRLAATLLCAGLAAAYCSIASARDVSPANKPAAKEKAHSKKAGSKEKAPPKEKPEHQWFGVIGHSFSNRGGEAQLQKSLGKMKDPLLAFVVATGIKAASEPCTDALYERRRDMFEDAKRPVVVLPAASDWAECKNGAGRPAAIERLNRLREVLYAGPAALGQHSLPLTRQSASAKFRSYAENAYWVVGNVLYATVNLPGNNNHYRPEAGRNSEFEDRAVANRFWLKRLFAQARRNELEGIVLFSEGDVKILTDEPGLLARFGRGPQPVDGYAAQRRQIVQLASQYEGKVLLIDTAPVGNGSEPTIAWRGNLGHASIGARAVQVQVTPKVEPVFTLEEP